MQRAFVNRLMIGVVAVAASLASSFSAGSAVSSSAAIQQLVAQGTAVRVASPSVAVQLQHAATASFESYDPGCVNFTGSCTFGDPAGTTTIALFGDSHAQEWLPAFVEAFPHAQIRMHWFPACPAATLRLWTPSTRAYSPKCVAWRASTIKQLVTAKSTMIVLFEQTGHTYTSPTTLATDAEWSAGIKATIGALRPSHAKLVVMGDNPFYRENPATCLSRNLRSVNRCTVDLPMVGPDFRNHQRAEERATIASHVPYVATTSWFCTAAGKCPSVIGNSVAYVDASHMTVAYAKLLGPLVREVFSRYLR
jgi:hypothetical protein